MRTRRFVRRLWPNGDSREVSISVLGLFSNVSHRRSPIAASAVRLSNHQESTVTDPSSLGYGKYHPTTAPFTPASRAREKTFGRSLQCCCSVEECPAVLKIRSSIPLGCTSTTLFPRRYVSSEVDVAPDGG